MTKAQAQKVAAALAEELKPKGGVRIGVREGSRVEVTVGKVTASGTVRLAGWWGSKTQVPVELDGTSQTVVVPQELLTVTKR